MKAYMTHEVAEKYGVQLQTITSRAKRLGLVPVGRRAGTLLWSADQVRRLAPRPVGRPRKAT